MTLRIISGLFKGRLLKAPKGPSTRPTQGMLREAVFNICQNEIENARFLDLFAGSGAMAFEALSRGALHATLVESNRNALACLQDNIRTLQIESQATLIPAPAERALSRLTKEKALFDIVYLDPPYDKQVELESLLPLLALPSILFLEERYDPKKKPKSYEFPQLKLRDRRRFGIALLSIFDYLG